MADNVTEQGWVGGYRLIRVIGRGGTGTVWEAEDGGGTRVALKLLHPSLSATDAARARLLREARLVNRVRSGGVARVIDVEADATSPFVVTELIEGTTLEQEIARFPYTPEDAAQLGTELAEVLDSVHAAGIAHRDLKPSNVILTDDGPVLIDFGIAHGEGDQHLTQTGLVTGTPGYVSPELLANPDASLKDLQAGDWFAWSALLLKAVTGRPPFGEGRPELSVKRVLEGEPDVLGLEEELAEAFQVALHPDPQRRATPAWLIADLAGEQSSASPPTRIVDLPATNPQMQPTAVWTYPPNEDDTIDTTAAPANAPWTAAELTKPPTSPALAPPGQVPFPSEVFSTPPYANEPRPLSGFGGFLLSVVFMSAAAWLPALARFPGLVALVAVLAFGQLLGATVVSSWRRRDYLARGSRQRAWATTMGTPLRALGAALALLPGLAAGAAVFYLVATLGAVASGQPFDLAIPAGWLTGAEAPGLTATQVWASTLAGLVAFWLLPSSRPVRIGLSRLAELAAPRPILRFLLGFALLTVAAVCTGIALAL